MPSTYFSLTPEELLGALAAETPAHELCTSKPALNRQTILASVPGTCKRPVILTGHQPVFHHPGILIKNMLADTLATSLGGSSVHLIHDCDQEEVHFHYPERTGSIVRKRTFRLSPGAEILKEERLTQSARDQFLRLLDRMRRETRLVFAPDRATPILRGFDVLSSAAEKAARAMDIPEAMRSLHKGRSVSISSTELFASDAFKCFVEYIAEHADEFRTVHNTVLADYRQMRGIKNPAQPLPDLKPGELPFWTLHQGRREPLTGAAGRGQILPRAVTLTLFCRLFLCDLFIHGLGGERYDRITDEILRRFFGGAGAPFIAASATLALSSRADLRLYDREEATIARDFRFLEFDPTRFLPVDHPVRRQKEELIRQRHREPEKRREIHRQFLQVNKAARGHLEELKNRLESERIHARTAQSNRTFFKSRDLAFFFYDTAPLETAVRTYGAGLKRSPNASLAEVRS